MKRLEAGNRFLITIAGILTILALRQWEVVALSGFVLLIISMLQQKIWQILRGFRLASPFLAAAVLLGWFSSGGWTFAGMLLLRLAVLVCWNSWILAGLTEMELIRGLREIWLPQVLVLTIFFILRYRELLREELRDLRLAREIRGGRLKNRFSLGNYRVLGQIMGAGLVRALDRGDRVYQAMRLRGLKAETLVRREGRLMSQTGWFVLTLLVVGFILVVDRGGLL